jgi:hypothetical protein
MPQEEDPRCARWSPAIAGALRSLREGAILVGHSVGGTVLLKTLADQPSVPAIGAIILIAAPFVGAGGWSSDDLRFPPNLGAQLPKNVPLHFFHGLADEVAPPSHADLYARAVAQAHVHRLPGRDHQFNDDLKEVAMVIRSLHAAGMGALA